MRRQLREVSSLHTNCRMAIRAVPDDRILIETDAPDIMPHYIVDGASCSVQEEHGNVHPPPAKLETTHKPIPTELEAPSTPINEPANLRHVLAKAAELRGISEEALAELTFRNAERFFFFS
jgi:Tat protein secretion system quality control protein TatD with DNase activity